MFYIKCSLVFLDLFLINQKKNYCFVTLGCVSCVSFFFGQAFTEIKLYFGSKSITLYDLTYVYTVKLTVFPDGFR